MTVPDMIINSASEASTRLRSRCPANEAMHKLVSKANAPETAMAWPAWPSLTRSSVAIGVSRLTGMNSEATKAKAASAIASTAPQAAVPWGWALASGRVFMVFLQG